MKKAIARRPWVSESSRREGQGMFQVTTLKPISCSGIRTGCKTKCVLQPAAASQHATPRLDPDVLHGLCFMKSRPPSRNSDELPFHTTTTSSSFLSVSCLHSDEPARRFDSLATRFRTLPARVLSDVFVLGSHFLFHWHRDPRSEGLDSRAPWA